MRHHNTVLHQILKLVPWYEFEKLVEEHKSDRRVRNLPTKAQLIAMLYGQLCGAKGLREIEDGLSSHSSRLYHLGGTVTKRSTLSDANRLRPADVFSGLFEVMVKQADRGLRRKLGEATYLIDATPLPLDGRSDDWARFSAKVCGAKVHVIFDPQADRPIYFALSAANVNDITEAKKMPIQEGSTYVFDLGYYSFAWWAELEAADCRFVTRLKKNTPLKVIEELAVPQSSSILSDRIGFLPERLSYTSKNPFPNAVREICVKTDEGKLLRIVSNDLDAPAQEIADLYKQRWLIELFFRWIKQTLKIRHFLGTSQNAVRIQVAVALIAYLLLRLAQALQHKIHSPIAYARLVRANLMHKKRIDRLRDDDPLAPENPSQMVLQWS